MRLHRPDPEPAREKFALARQELSSALVERDEEVDVVLTALAAGEHPLLVGPPGTAKSLLLDSLMRWAGGNRFTAWSSPTKMESELRVVLVVSPLELGGGDVPR